MSTEALPSASVSLEELVGMDPSTALYLPLAERLLSRGLVSDAVRLCEERRSRPGRGVGDHIVLGRCYLADGRLPEAREQFLAALVLDRENVVALKSMAGILSHEGSHAEAADLYRAVCRVDPGDLESQSALHQITSGDYPEVRPPEVIVSQGDLTWQPIRLTREEDHLSELGLGLRTFDSLETGPLRPSLPTAELTASGTAPSELERVILTPEDLSVGPHFPPEQAEERAPSEPVKAPRPLEVVVPAGAIPPRGLHNRLGSLDVQEFQVSALERLEAALRQVEVRALGEVAAAEAADTADSAPAARAIVAAPAAPARTAPTRSAVWDEEPAVAAALPTPAPAPMPAAPLAGFPEGDESAARPVVEGNRTAFETWLRRLGGK
ncbi:MAG: hypothetical protein AAB011_02715 [Candidatus Eisenbacteria bacterium]